MDSIFLVIGGIVGSGIFMTTGFIAEYLPSPLMILIVWLLGGFFAICGALAFAELGAMYPRAGGQYIYLRFKQPETPRPYKAWGYPVLPVLFVFINLGVFVNTIWAQPLQSLIGLVILLAGIPAFLYWQSKDKSA